MIKEPLLLTWWKTECDGKTASLYASEPGLTSDCYLGMVDITLEVLMLKFWELKG